MKQGRKRAIVAAAGTIAALAVCSLVLLYLNPFWLVDRGTDIYLWRHGVQHHYVNVNAHRIHYLEALPKQAGPDKPVLLIHGLGARGSDWAVLTPALAAHGYHVYALDLLGYGASDKPLGGDFSLSSEERIISGFVDTLHIQKPDVAGWSMGGWLAAKYALDEPEKVHRLLLYDSAGLYMPLDFPLQMFAPSSKADLDALLYRIEPYKPFIRLPSFAVPGLLRRFHHSARVVDSTLASMLDGKEILDFRLQHLKMPVLIVWGTEDKLTPMTMAEKMHELLPQSVLVRIKGCGHLAVAECASQVIPVTLRFLAADPPLTSIDRTLPAKKR